MSISVNLIRFKEFPEERYELKFNFNNTIFQLLSSEYFRFNKIIIDGIFSL